MILNEIHFNQTLHKLFNSSWGGRGDWKLRSGRFLGLLERPSRVGSSWSAGWVRKSNNKANSMKFYLSCFGPLEALGKNSLKHPEKQIPYVRLLYFSLGN